MNRQESMTITNINNKNDPQKKHRLGTVCKTYILKCNLKSRLIIITMLKMNGNIFYIIINSFSFLKIIKIHAILDLLLFGDTYQI